MPPKHADDHYVRGLIYQKKGSFAAATAEFGKAIELAPKRVEILNDVAWVKATAPEAPLRDGKTAVALSTKACELTNWRNPDYIDTLAATYAEQGDFAQAVRYQAQAVAAKRFAPRVRQEMEERLALYRARKPYRKKPDAAAP